MDDQYFNRLFETHQPKLTFPHEPRAVNEWAVYKPSFFSQNFASEKDRQLYAEAFIVRPPPHTGPELPAHLQKPCTEVQSLKRNVLQYLLLEYKGGPFSDKVLLYDKVWVGENMSVELNVQDIVDLDNNVFWKRVAEAKCKNKVFLMECARDFDYDYKSLGIECKLQEIFEKTTRENWNIEKMAAICQAVAPYVRRLQIDQLIGIDYRFLETNPYNPLYKIFNYPAKDCHHGNIGDALSYLVNLETLSIQFGMEKVSYYYDERFFKVSYQDIEDLAQGLSKLSKLTSLTIKNTMLDDRKCKILIKGILDCPLKVLRFPYCRLGRAVGYVIGHYLLYSGGTLKELELRDNNISGDALQGIGYGIQEYKGELEYIGLSGNPIEEAGLVAIGSGLCEREQVKRIDLSRCTIQGEGVFRIIQMINFHQRLEWLNLSGIYFGASDGDQLVFAVTSHFNLLFLEARGCGLLENQQRKLTMLIERNHFYKANPCMKKDFYSDDDIEEIEEWILKTKHPLYLRVLGRTDSTETFDQFDVRRPVSIGNVPDFVPKAQRRVQSTSEIMKMSYIDCFGSDSEMRLYETVSSAEIISDINEVDIMNFDPNVYEPDEFISAVTIGRRVGLACKQYFSTK